MLIAVALIHFGIAGVFTPPPATLVLLQIIGAVAGTLLLIGLWTPVAGTLAVIAKVSIALARHFSHSGDPLIPVLEALLSAILAMVGPGTWSIDARLYGRKLVNFPEHR